MRESGERTAVVLDDHPLWLDAVEQLLDRVGVKVVGKTTEPEDALALIEEHRPDVLLAQYSVSDGELDAMTCLRRAREMQPGLKAVVLSATDHPQQVESAFAAGASVFCVKTADPDDLLTGIRQAFHHSIYLASSSAVAAPREPVAKVEDSPELTRRELEILQLVAEGHSNSQLAKMLWVTEQTVKFHLSNIYRKLDVANRTEASRWAQLHGLLPTAQPATTAA
jgi:DNA-binding NarL/FixJ family response regulator